MKVSIITVVFNNVQTIADAIESVLSQDYNDIEFIIVDGGSTDGTIDIIKTYSDKIARWISESDNGIYDAMNKGIMLASGDIIAILNSDDFYNNEFAISKVVHAFKANECDCVYSDVLCVDKYDNNKIIRNARQREYSDGLFVRGWHPPHPSFYVKKNIYEKYGNFNLNYKIAADYELMLRFLERYKISASYIPEVLVRMRLGGESTKSIRNIVRSNIESYRAWRENGLRINLFSFIRKPLSKIKQFVLK